MSIAEKVVLEPVETTEVEPSVNRVASPFVRAPVEAIVRFPVPTPVRASYRIPSRIIDIVLGSTMFLLALPILLLACAGIKLTSAGPVMFKQRRAGRFGNAFTMYKLRTMVKGADDERGRHRTPAAYNGPVFKHKSDPRVTTFGWLLRKTSIDELPQLLNVIRGDMSLVGPRPLPLDEVRLDSLPERLRLTVKPGITGLWQVSGRADIPYDEWVELDMYYVRNCSLWLDAQILLRTIPAVISCRGAY